MDPGGWWTAAITAAAVVLAGCSGSRSADDTLPPLPERDPPSTAATIASATAGPAATTSSPPTTHESGSTEPPITHAPSTEAPAPTTEGAAEAGDTTVPDTDGDGRRGTTQPPRGTAGRGSAVVLGPEGLGIATFGDDADRVIAAAVDVLGEPGDDTGWQEPFEAVACTDGDYRAVTWGSLSLLFSDSSEAFGSGPRHFFGYEYGTVGQPDAEPSGFTTSDGVGVGTTVADLRDAYPGVQVHDGEDGLFSPEFYVTDGFQGLLTGTDDDDVVSMILGGQPCGL